MALSAVINRSKFETLDDPIKALYRPIGDTFQLDLENTTLSEHAVIREFTDPLASKVQTLEQENVQAKQELEDYQLTLNKYATENNKRAIKSTIDEATKNLDLGDGRGELINKLLEPTISTVLQNATEKNAQLDETELRKLISSEIKNLQKLSASTFVEKKPDTTLRYLKKEGVQTSPSDSKEEAKDGVNYDKFTGQLNEIDYNDFMENYFEVQSDNK